MWCLYSLHDARVSVSVSVPSDKARAVVESPERDMLTHPATKSDVDALRNELRADVALVRQESNADIALLRYELGAGLSALRKDMTIWLGSVRIIGMRLLFAAPELTWRDARPCHTPQRDRP